MLTKNTVVLAKNEAVYGTDIVPTEADAILVSSPSLKVDGKLLTRDFVRQTLTPLGHVIGNKKVDVSYDVELKGSGTAGTAPEFGPLLRACGLEETVVASTSVTYTPRSTLFESATQYVYFDGLLHKIPGCVGTCSFDFSAGGYPKLHFEMQGKYTTPIDAALPAAPVFDATKPQIIQGANFAVNAYAAVINKLAFSLATTIAAPGDVNSADGFGAMRITGRDPNGSFDPEAVTRATHDFWADWEAAVARAITITVGATAGNIVDFDVDQAVYREIGYGDREGIRTYEMPFSATGAGDDEMELIFT